MAKQVTQTLAGAVPTDAVTAEAGETVYFYVIGTYTASFQFERERKFGGGNWEPIGPVYSTANATVSFSIAAKDTKQRYRVNGVDYTSGGVICFIEAVNPNAAGLGSRFNTLIPDAELRSVDISQKVTVFDDFVGTIKDLWSSTAGSGTGNAAATISAGSGGRITIKSASNDGTDAANASNITMDTLDWKANQGGLVMEARLQLDAVTAVALFVGFTDTISTTVEMPMFLVAGDIDSTATDACGVGFDTDGDTDQWFHGGVADGTDTVPVYWGGGPSAATYYTVRVEVGKDGSVQGFIDGYPVGPPVPAAVTPTVALTPCIVVNNRGAAQRIVTIDYIWVQADRS